MFNRTTLLTLITLLLSLPSHVSQAHNEQEKQQKLALIKQLKDTGKTVYAMIPKSTNDPFFSYAAKGCQKEAERLGVHCIYYGSDNENPRLQEKDLLALINAGVDGIAISAIVDGWLTDRQRDNLRRWGKPIVAFDSPLSNELSAAYIGTNNYLLGKQLGTELRQLKPSGGTYCLHSERPDSPNHQDRMRGIIDGLTDGGNEEGKWLSGFSCPLYHYGDFYAAVNQMIRVIKNFDVDTFISTGGGSQFLPEKYRQGLAPYKNAILEGQLTIASIDTLPVQLEYLHEGLSSLNVGQRPAEMGKWSLHILDLLTNGHHAPLIINTGLTVCLPDTTNDCTDHSGLYISSH